MSWLEDFADGEALWKRLMAAPTFGSFLEQSDRLSRYEWQHVLLYHAIREKQEQDTWSDWSRDVAT